MASWHGNINGSGISELQNSRRDTDILLNLFLCLTVRKTE
jgi:hypothetical protein